MGIMCKWNSFQCSRDSQFCELFFAINRAPPGYMAPSYEKAITSSSLLDECKKNVKKEMFLVKVTWYSHGVFILLDGWSNLKHMQIIFRV